MRLQCWNWKRHHNLDSSFDTTKPADSLAFLQTINQGVDDARGVLNNFSVETRLTPVT
jgi:hypothetical protein